MPRVTIPRHSQEKDPAGRQLDRPELLDKQFHPPKAKDFQREWDFIGDDAVRANIAYHLQTLDWIGQLYNHYRIYLTVEALLVKLAVTMAAAIIEGALWDIICGPLKRSGKDVPYMEYSFTELLEEAQQKGILTPRDMMSMPAWGPNKEGIRLKITKRILGLKRLRNQLHIGGREPDLGVFKIEHIQQAVWLVEDFRDYLSKYCDLPRYEIKEYVPPVVETPTIDEAPPSIDEETVPEMPQPFIPKLKQPWWRRLFG